MWIELTEAEQRLAKYLAKARYQYNRRNGVQNAKIGRQSDEMTDLEGIAAEIAFCKMMNVYPDLQVGEREIADAYTKALGGVDVKTTKHQDGRLLATLKKAQNHGHSYVLMVGEFPKYRYVGWADARELLTEDNIRDLGHGPTYAMDQSDLRREMP